MDSPVRRARPRPVEHFDEMYRLGPLIALLCLENASLRSDVAAWRRRFYAASQAPAASLPLFEPAIPEQRTVPDDEHLPRTNRYQDLRLRRLDQ